MKKIKKSFVTKTTFLLTNSKKRCGIGNGTVGRWKNNASKPTLYTLEKIEKATNIPILIWLDNAEEK